MIQDEPSELVKLLFDWLVAFGVLRPLALFARCGHSTDTCFIDVASIHQVNRHSDQVFIFSSTFFSALGLRIDRQPHCHRRWTRL